LKDGGDAKGKVMLDRFVGARNAHDLDGIMASLTRRLRVLVFLRRPSAGGVPKAGKRWPKVFAANFRSFPDAAWTEGRTTLFRFRAQ
jgi:hypothetical protein